MSDTHHYMAAAYMEGKVVSHIRNCSHITTYVTLSYSFTQCSAGDEADHHIRPLQDRTVLRMVSEHTMLHKTPYKGRNLGVHI